MKLIGFVMLWYACCISICVCFFFQAEDGIRDLVRSRGLGDVYKRQVEGHRNAVRQGLRVVAGRGRRAEDLDHADHCAKPVSYTHLTLPTSDLV